jgi:predicted nucleic acid-binding protein
VNLAEALRDVTLLFLDTAPVIYYVERNPQYFPWVSLIFDRIDNGALTGVTSPITLAECLVVPYRLGQVGLQQDFFDLIVHGAHTVFCSLDQENARRAAELRACHNLTLSDALQVAVALMAGCQAFLTNDNDLKRVPDLRIVVLDELTD